MAKGSAKNIFQPTFPISLSGVRTEEFENFDVITSHGKLDRGSVWKNVTSHAQGREPTPV